MLDVSAILLTDKTAVVTGGGQGLGEAIALNLAAFGANVAVLDIDEGSARRTAERVRETGRRSLAVRADVSLREDVDAALERTRRELGEIDVLVNNAGDLTDPRPALTITDERFDYFLRSNLRSVWLCSTDVARRWIELGRPGAIVNLATTEAIRGCPNWSAYSAAKAGIINLTKTLSSEWGPHGIRVNAIAPDYTPSPGTEFSGRRLNDADPGSLVFRDRPAAGQESLAGVAPFIPLRRYGSPDDTAGLAIFLASEMSAWITGQTIVVDGGSLACARVEGPLPLPMFLDLDD
ncbi:MAG: SDR family oxidoreductase [Proteobacteria bacterium]|nr:SDR family oxidoreductase [Pseudomonadota bacterium]